MGRRNGSTLTSLWLDEEDYAKIKERATAKGLSKGELMRRMIKWALAAADPAEPVVTVQPGRTAWRPKP